jgi:mRNA-degrading endonuclease RelE of RelBE toxin-antitoxin system
MIEVRVTREFEKRFRDLPVLTQRRAEKQERLFRENPFHPSLHTEKLQPKEREVWSFRVDRSCRIIFRFLDGKTALFLTVGPHDWVYRMRW